MEIEAREFFQYLAALIALHCDSLLDTAERTDEIEGQGRTTGVQQVFEHGVLHVFEPNGSRTHHSKARLHKEDHSTTDQQQKTAQIFLPCVLQTLCILKRITDTLQYGSCRIKFAAAITFF